MMKSQTIVVSTILVMALGAFFLSSRYRDEDKQKMVSYNLYQSQATAQAYKPNSPESTSLCFQPRRRSKVATWPYSRSRSLPVNLKLVVRLWSCPYLDGNSQNCRNMLGDSYSNQHNLTLEIWQARPDGTYSSLTGDDYDCRARIVPNSLDASSSVLIDTFAPGSTGCLGGLGPKGWDFPPYGPPVIHFLILDHKNHHLPLLVDVPVTFHRKTLKFTNTFSLWPDWRGAGWMAPRNRHGRPSFEVRSWEPNVAAKSREIKVNIDFFLIQNDGYEAQLLPTLKWLCPSRLFSPKSFFLEPISVCSAWILDFFAI